MLKKAQIRLGIFDSLTLCVCLLFFGSTSWVSATEDVETILWATPEWVNYTNQDGTGLYNEIMTHIFQPLNISLVKNYVPLKRAIFMVENKEADMTGGANESHAFILSRHPVVKNIDSVFFEKHLIPEWKGIESLKGKKGAWYRGYGLSEKIMPYLNGKEVNQREQALRMVLERHGVDYYFDNEDQLQQTIKTLGAEVDMDSYQIEAINETHLYWGFQDSERGRKLRELFEQGMERLFCTGELEKIYARWNQNFPEYQITCSTEKNDCIGTGRKSKNIYFGK